MMNYLHTMMRIKDIGKSLEFYCEKLGMVEINRIENKDAKFTLIFLAAKDDAKNAKNNKSPLLELTYNWPDENGNTEDYTVGRNFGHLAFRVDNIYETCKNLMDKGVIINRPPRDGYMAFIKSPDNISIELLQNGEKLPKQEPWASMKNIGSW